MQKDNPSEECQENIRPAELLIIFLPIDSFLSHCISSCAVFFHFLSFLQLLISLMKDNIKIIIKHITVYVSDSLS